MALTGGGLPLPIRTPIPPDRWLCHRSDGVRPILPLDCQVAVDQNWPNDDNFVRYFQNDPRPSAGEWIPNFAYLGSCRVSIETAGPPEHLPHSVLLRPRELRGLAGFLIQKCAVENRGIGGFVTIGFTSALSYIHNPTKTWGGNFLTISIQPRLRRNRNLNALEPGSHDTNIAVMLSAHAVSLGQALGNSGRKLFYDAIAIDLHYRALEMQGSYDSNLTWWSKDGVWSWWAQRYYYVPRTRTRLSSGGNRTVTSGHLGDQESIGEPGEGSSNSSSTEKEDGKKQDEGDGEGEEGRGEAQGNSDRGADTPQQEGVRGGEGDTNGDNGDEATSPIRGNREQGANEAEAGDNADVGDMTYQCDDTLGGGPDPMDCEKLSWSGLKPPDSIETLQPGVPKFYSQGTCALGISSMAPTTIMWAHLIAAFETLNMFCVQNPIKSIKGGRAYYGKQTVSSWINGKAKRDATDDAVNATEALPPGINATVFKHNPKSQLACEWTLAEEGKNLSSCRSD